MMPIFSRSGGWHCAGSGAMVLALAWSAFWPIRIGPRGGTAQRTERVAGVLLGHLRGGLTLGL